MTPEQERVHQRLVAAGAVVTQRGLGYVVSRGQRSVIIVDLSDLNNGDLRALGLMPPARAKLHGRWRGVEASKSAV